MQASISKINWIYAVFKNAFRCADVTKVQFLKSPLGCNQIKMMNEFGFAYSMQLYRYVGILGKHMSKNTLPAEKTCARSIPSLSNSRMPPRGQFVFSNYDFASTCHSITVVPLAKGVAARFAWLISTRSKRINLKNNQRGRKEPLYLIRWSLQLLIT